MSASIKDLARRPSRRWLQERPHIIAKFWRNRSGEAIVIQVREFGGHVVLDTRVYEIDGAGKMKATSKGLSIGIAKLPELARAINRAVNVVRELELLEPERKP
jgi:hypothetical protein